VQFAPVNISNPAGSAYYFPALLARNNTPNTHPYSSYTDMDGIRRMGDSGIFDSTKVSGTAGNPFNHTVDRTIDRPIILNRPFQSVGELGYVFRDDPWRSLDFFSPESADAGLLDLFSVEDVDVSAARVDLNTRQAPVFQAILSGVAKSGTQTFAASPDPANIAATIVAVTGTNPVVNRADLVTRFRSSQDDDVRFQSLPALSFSNTEDNQIKPQRESIVRALADVGNTRTWNLMIDVVAQAGQFPPAAASLDQFVVGGQRHYWFHVAIDRVTGQVIDKQLELVTE